jgi:hypothetical protein
MDTYYFLRRFESIAVVHGLRLCMTRAPLGCGLLFYFIDDHSAETSELYCFQIHHDSYENLFENLERIAKDFKEKETKTND